MKYLTKNKILFYLLMPVLIVALAFAGILYAGKLTAHADKIGYLTEDYIELTSISSFSDDQIENITPENWESIITEDTYQVRLTDGLRKLANMVYYGASFEGKVIYLTASVNFNAFTINNYTPIGTSENPFKGTFNGLGNSVNGINLINVPYNNPIGFFGDAEDATIVNLIVSGDISLSSNKIGGIAGVAKNTFIINCTNRINITGSTGNIGSIAGSAEDSVIANCLNRASVTAFAGSADNTQVSNCVNYEDWLDFTEEEQIEHILLMNNYIISLTEEEGITDLIFWGLAEGLPSLGADPILEDWYVYETELKEHVYELIKFAYFGNPDPDNGYEGILELMDGAQPSILEELETKYLQALADAAALKISDFDYNTKEFFNAAYDIIIDTIDFFDEQHYNWAYDSDAKEAIYETLLKDFAREMIEFSFTDNRSFMEDSKIENLLKIDKKHLESLVNLSSLKMSAFINLTDNATQFFNAVREVINDAIYGFDDIYFEWADTFEESEALNYENRLRIFALSSITFSYRIENLSFMIGDDADTLYYQELLTTSYQNSVINLNNISMFIKEENIIVSIRKPLDYFNDVSILMENAIDDFNLIFWEWYYLMEDKEVESFRQEQRDELKAAYKHKLSIISDIDTRAKLKSVYTKALSIINDTELNDNWGNFAYILGTTVSDAKAEFNKIQNDLEKARTTLILIIVFSVIGGLIVATGVVFLVIFIKKKTRGFVIHEGIDEDQSRNAQLVKEKATLMQRILKLEREKKELIAQMQKDKIAEIGRLNDELKQQFEKEKEELIKKANEEKKDLAIFAAQKVKEKVTEEIIKAKDEAKAQEVKRTITELEAKKVKLDSKSQSLLEQMTAHLNKDNK